MSPPRKVLKKEEPNENTAEAATNTELAEVARKVNCVESGVIVFEVDKISKMKEGAGKFSPLVKVGGVMWRVRVCKEAEDEEPNDEEQVAENDANLAKEVCDSGDEEKPVKYNLSAFLFTENESPTWSIEVKHEHILINHKDPSKNVVIKDFNDPPFSYEFESSGDKLIPWEEAMNKKNGFIKDDKVTVETRFSIINKVGIRTTIPIDHTDPRDSRHDVAFVINGEKVHAKKGILEYNSEVFYVMFHLNPEQNEFELKDVVKEEFIELLRVLYPSPHAQTQVTDANVEYLLKLADKYEINFVLDMAESRLMSGSKKEYMDKLLLSDKHGLVRLQGQLLHLLSSEKEVKLIEKSPQYAQFSAELKAILRLKFADDEEEQDE